MTCNNGTQTKKITLIVPESIEFLDITYFWKTAKGVFTKTNVFFSDVNCQDGSEVPCCRFDDVT